MRPERRPLDRSVRPLRHLSGWAVFAAGASLGLSDAVRWITHHG